MAQVCPKALTHLRKAVFIAVRQVIQMQLTATVKRAQSKLLQSNHRGSAALGSSACPDATPPADAPTATADVTPKEVASNGEYCKELRTNLEYFGTKYPQYIKYADAARLHKELPWLQVGQTHKAVPAMEVIVRLLRVLVARDLWRQTMAADERYKMLQHAKTLGLEALDLCPCGDDDMTQLSSRSTSVHSADDFVARCVTETPAHIHSCPQAKGLADIVTHCLTECGYTRRVQGQFGDAYGDFAAALALASDPHEQVRVRCLLWLLGAVRLADSCCPPLCCVPQAYILYNAANLCDQDDQRKAARACHRKALELLTLCCSGQRSDWSQAHKRLHIKVQTQAIKQEDDNSGNDATINQYRNVVKLCRELDAPRCLLARCLSDCAQACLQQRRKQQPTYNPALVEEGVKLLREAEQLLAQTLGRDTSECATVMLRQVRAWLALQSLGASRDIPKPEADKIKELICKVCTLRHRMSAPASFARALGYKGAVLYCGVVCVALACRTLTARTVSLRFCCF